MTAKQLRKLLDDNGFTQEGLAALLGITGRQMRRYVADEVAIPRPVEMAITCLVGLCKTKEGKR